MNPLTKLATLALLLMVSARIQAQVKTMTGLVIDEQFGNKWTNIVIETGGNKYGIQTSQATSVGDEKMGLKGWEVKTVGDASRGHTVKVFYKKMDCSHPLEGVRCWVTATRIVEVTGPTTNPRGNVAPRQGNLIGVLTAHGEGPGCSFVNGRGIVFYDQWDIDQQWMNIDGTNTRLTLVNETKPKGRRVGTRITKRYSAGDITVDMVEVLTKVSTSNWSATFTVRRGDRQQVIPATGTCSD